MLNLSIDPPHYQRGSKGGLARYVVFALLLAAAGAGGFVAGRKTAPRAGGTVPATAAARAAGELAQQPAGSPPARSAPASAQPASPEPGLAGGATTVAARETSPSATASVPAAAPVPAAPVAPPGPLIRRTSVVLKGALEESVTAALAPEERAWGEQLTQVVNRILVWSLQVARDGRRGDKLEILYELPSPQPTETVALGDAGPVNKEPVVLALRYGSQKLGKIITAYRFKPEGSAFARYYTAEGTEVEERLVDSPIDTYEQVTSLLRDGRHHKGVDFKTPVGTPVKAPFDGVVRRRTWNFGANGNCIEIVDGKSGRHAIFLHLEAVPKDMQPGRHVKKGEVIARSGNSGHSTAPHLHYQLESPSGRILDPYAVHATHRLALEGAAKAAFEQERQRLEPMLMAATAAR
jgi:murein DD-endopeptidase